MPANLFCIRSHVRSIRTRTARLILLLSLTVLCPASLTIAADDITRETVSAAMRRAAVYFHDDVAVQGGYVYFYSPDLKKRWGEGAATPTQIWVQPPGTPTVGRAYLQAWKATGDHFYLNAARDAAIALVYGQLQSGGWTNKVDFNPTGDPALYRNGKGKGRNYSTLDDDITQAALRLMLEMDQALEFKDAAIHEPTQAALDALLKAQFPNGGFPQVWSAPVEPRPIVKANYFDGDWEKESRFKEYWTQYTLNDDLAGSVSETLLAAWAIYKDERCRQALIKLGDFLLLAQMPEPQPAWAQQYNAQMQPIWARKFEPPAIAGRESQDALETLLKVYRLTRDEKYLAPFPSALAWLKRSRLKDGRLARYYELKTNRPLYMTDDYKLTHDDSNVPDHYGWKNESQIEELEQAWHAARDGKPVNPEPAVNETDVRLILKTLDDRGRWTATYDGQRLVGQAKMKVGEVYLSSPLFSQNLETLSRWLIQQRKAP